jgi:hypothetical protein
MKLYRQEMHISRWSIGDLSTWQWSDTEQVIATTGVLTLLALILAAVIGWKQVQIRSGRHHDKQRRQKNHCDKD